MLLTHETLAWARQSDQEVLYMKLGFTKAYDMVAWDFMFQAMRVIGIHSRCIELTKPLFQEASAVMNLNAQTSKSFDIQGVH